MMTFVAYEDRLHVMVPCPSCGKTVPLVASFDNDLARWCCVSCQTVGEAPVYRHVVDGLRWEAKLSAARRDPRYVS